MNKFGRWGKQKANKVYSNFWLLTKFCFFTLFHFLGYARGAGGAHWPFLNKVSALPHLMPFKAAQDDKTKKMVSESFLSSGFMPISTADAFDHCQKQAPCEIQVCVAAHVLIHLLATGGCSASVLHI